MNVFTRNSLAGAGVVSAIFVGALVYMARALPAMTAQSQQKVERYFQLAKAGDFAGAHKLLSPQLQRDIPRAQLEKQWRETQRKYGEIRDFVGADTSSANGARTNLWPPYVDYMIRARAENGSQVFYFRVQPNDENQWQISDLRALDQTKIAMPKGSPLNDWKARIEQRTPTQP